MKPYFIYFLYFKESLAIFSYWVIASSFCYLSRLLSLFVLFSVL